MAIKNRPEFEKFLQRVEKSSDEFRASSKEKRHAKKYRTARENLAHLIDKDSFLEFGQFAVAAQRSRRDYEELQDKTNADGIITGFCSVNSENYISSERRRPLIKKSILITLLET